ncbi:hypothetical protein [Helicobacter felis]|uniref:hypothetical protein n=1 Tax=Helicobacter felis TaxID=214 RepID=UPI000CF07AC9|nr:hypothetical protein [Helicobacter felis]
MKDYLRAKHQFLNALDLKSAKVSLMELIQKHRITLEKEKHELAQSLYEGICHQPHPTRQALLFYLLASPIFKADENTIWDRWDYQFKLDLSALAQLLGKDTHGICLDAEQEIHRFSKWVCLENAMHLFSPADESCGHFAILNQSFELCDLRDVQGRSLKRIGNFSIAKTLNTREILNFLESIKMMFSIKTKNIATKTEAETNKPLTIDSGDSWWSRLLWPVAIPLMHGIQQGFQRLKEMTAHQQILLQESKVSLRYIEFEL